LQAVDFEAGADANADVNEDLGRPRRTAPLTPQLSPATAPTSASTAATTTTTTTATAAAAATAAAPAPSAGIAPPHTVTASSIDPGGAAITYVQPHCDDSFTHSQNHLALHSIDSQPQSFTRGHPNVASTPSFVRHGRDKDRMGRPVMPEPPFEEMVLEQINELREIMFSMMRLQRGEDVEPPSFN